MSLTHTPRGGLSAAPRRRWRSDDRYAVILALGAGALLQWAVTDEYALIRPGWLVPGLELLLVAILLISGVGGDRQHSWGRGVRLSLVALLSLDNAASAALLDLSIVRGGSGSLSPATLLESAAAIYLTNVIAFGVWYWELDRGGPRDRSTAAGQPDLLFPQMTAGHLVAPTWKPGFFDYLYVSLTNATAFSPTDTMPLSQRAKGLMALQALVALSTTALVVARAVNLLR